MKNIVILYSGGLDSFILYHYAKVNNPDANVKAIYWNHHQKVAPIEIKNLPDFVEVRNVDWMNLPGKSPIECKGRNEGKIFIPGRNLMFGVLCAIQELPDEIWMGTLGGETHNKGTDKNYQFLWTMNTTINYVLSPFLGERKIECKFPLADNNLNKKLAVKWALDNGLTPEQLIATYSCHSGDELPCGNCVQCVKRWAVFGEFGFTEQYQQNPATSPFGMKMWKEMLRCELGGENPYYNQESIDEIFPFFKTYALNNPHLFDEDFLNQLELTINE